MSSYAYCADCDFGLPAPTTREVIEDAWRCHHCGTRQYLEPEKQQEALLEILDRLEAVEKKLRQAVEPTACPGSDKCDDPGCPAHYAKSGPATT